MKNSQEGKKFSIRLGEDEYQKLSGLASEKGRNISEMVRELIYKQLGIDGANDGSDFIRRMFREEIQIQLKAQIERLVKIIIKIGMIEVSSVFYLKEILRLKDAKRDDELWDIARKNTAAYLGMRNNRAVEEVYKEFSENYTADYGGESDKN
jgi:predicted DNA-binding protein